MRELPPGRLSFNETGNRTGRPSVFRPVRSHACLVTVPIGVSRARRREFWRKGVKVLISLWFSDPVVGLGQPLSHISLALSEPGLDARPGGHVARLRLVESTPCGSWRNRSEPHLYDRVAPDSAKLGRRPPRSGAHGLYARSLWPQHPPRPPLRQKSLAERGRVSRVGRPLRQKSLAARPLGTGPRGLYARTLCAFWLANYRKLGVISPEAPTRV